jgi:hypothetical protein
MSIDNEIRHAAMTRTFDKIDASLAELDSLVARIDGMHAACRVLVSVVTETLNELRPAPGADPADPHTFYRDDLPGEVIARDARRRIADAAEEHDADMTRGPFAGDPLRDYPQAVFTCSACGEHDVDLAGMCVRAGCPKEHGTFTEPRFVRPS